MKFFIKLLNITLAVFIFFSVANAQDTEDVVYLKNGSVIRGMIIDWIPDSSVTIQIQGGSIFVYKWDDVLRIAKAPRNKPYTQNRSVKNNNDTKNKNISKFGVKGGLNLASWDVSGEGYNEDFSIRNTYGAGFFLYQRSNDSFGAIRFEILYLNKGAKETLQLSYYDESEINYKIETITLASFFLLETSNQPSCMFFEIGLELSYFISKRGEYDSYWVTPESDLENMTSNEIALDLGIGFLIDNTMHIDARYSIGLTELITDDNLGVSAMSRCFQIMVGFGF